MTARATSVPIKTVYIVTPIFVHAKEENFRSIVQKLTGLKRARCSSSSNNSEERRDEGKVIQRRLNLEAANVPMRVENQARSPMKRNWTEAWTVSPDKPTERSSKTAVSPVWCKQASVLGGEVNPSFPILQDSMLLPAAAIDCDVHDEGYLLSPHPTFQDSDWSQVLWDWQEIFATNT